MARISHLGNPTFVKIKERGSKVAMLAIATSMTALVLDSRPASGCSCAGPRPHWGFLGPDTGRLPANAAGVLWYLPPPSPWGDERSAKELDHLIGNLTVELRRATGYIDIPVRVNRYDGPLTRDWPQWERGTFFLVRPAEGLRPGKTYRFTDHSDDKWENDWPARGQRQVVFFVDRQELTPDTPLELDFTEPAIEDLRIKSMGGGCSETLRVSHAPLAAHLPAGADDWRDQLLYRTFVDGELWVGEESLCQTVIPGRTWMEEVGRDGVYRTCADDFASLGVPDGSRYSYWSAGYMPSGPHKVRIQAFLPGTDIVLETKTVTLDFTCPSPPQE